MGPGVVVRMGAAAFAVGLSLAGQAPSAMADEIDGRGSAANIRSEAIGVQAQGAIFFNANLNGVDFTNADLSNANLRGARVQGVTRTNCTCPDGELAPDSGCVG